MHKYSPTTKNESWYLLILALVLGSGLTLEVSFDTNSGMILLMVQKSETPTWDVFENPVN